MNKHFFHILWGLLLFAIETSLMAQGDPHPKHPEIVRVSVDTSTQRTVIEWKASISDDVEKYTMFFDTTDILGQTYPFPTLDTVDGNTTKYTYKKEVTTNKSRSFTVQAIDSSGLKSSFFDSHTTIHLTTDYDSCSKQMLLEWTSYKGWGGNLVRYDVYFRENQDSYSILEEGGTKDTTQLHLNIFDNRSYCYFIKAIKNDGTYSFSNIVCQNISHPIHPAWINAESASALDPDSVKLKFTIDPEAQVSSYQIFKATGPGKPFVADEIIRDVEHSLTYTDPVLSTEKQYQYKLYSLDVCDSPVTGSNIAGNIVLSASSEGLLASLSWTPYVEYEAGVEYYQVYRDINRSGPQPLEIVVYPDMVFHDDLSEFDPEKFEDEICYYVEAVENSGTLGDRGSSWSNRGCISVVPEITMANAFTPNDDGINDCIKPALTFIPKEYIFMVFDRWGSKIFHTEQPPMLDEDPCSYAWDGSIKGGQKVPEGVYVYYIKLTTSSGIEVEKTGEITVFYP